MAPSLSISVGCDPEFSLARDSLRINAASIRGSSTVSNTPFGVDGAGGPAELHPRPAFTEEEIIPNLTHDTEQVVRALWDGGIDSYSGAFAWGIPTGGHIHVGGLTWDERVRRALDALLGRPISLLFPAPAVKARLANGYGEIGAVSRTHTHHGWEYRTPPSWLASPAIAGGTMLLAWHICHALRDKAISIPYPTYPGTFINPLSDDKLSDIREGWIKCGAMEHKEVQEIWEMLIARVKFPEQELTMAQTWLGLPPRYTVPRSSGVWAGMVATDLHVQNGVVFDLLLQDGTNTTGKVTGKSIRSRTVTIDNITFELANDHNTTTVVITLPSIPDLPSEDMAQVVQKLLEMIEVPTLRPPLPPAYPDYLRIPHSLYRDTDVIPVDANYTPSSHRELGIDSSVVENHDNHDDDDEPDVVTCPNCLTEWEGESEATEYYVAYAGTTGCDECAAHCAYCRQNFFFTTDSGHPTRESYDAPGGEGVVCGDCWNEHVRSCHQCGTDFYTDDGNYSHEGEWYCDSCIQNIGHCDSCEEYTSGETVFILVSRGGMWDRVEYCRPCAHDMPTVTCPNGHLIYDEPHQETCPGCGADIEDGDVDV